MNTDVNRRDNILFGEDFKPESEETDLIGVLKSVDYSGGLRSFSDVSLETMKKLVEEDFIDVDAHYTHAPSMSFFLTYAEKHPSLLFGGCATAPDRDDYGIYINRVSQTFENSSEKEEFKRCFGTADMLNVSDNNGFAWWS